MSCRIGYGYWARGPGCGRFGSQKSQPEPSLIKGTTTTTTTTTTTIKYNFVKIQSKTIFQTYLQIHNIAKSLHYGFNFFTTKHAVGLIATGTNLKPCKCTFATIDLRFSLI